MHSPATSTQLSFLPDFLPRCLIPVPVSFAQSVILHPFSYKTDAHKSLSLDQAYREPSFTFVWITGHWKDLSKSIPEQGRSAGSNHTERRAVSPAEPRRREREIHHFRGSRRDSKTAFLEFPVRS